MIRITGRQFIEQAAESRFPFISGSTLMVESFEASQGLIVDALIVGANVDKPPFRILSFDASNGSTLIVSICDAQGKTLMTGTMASDGDVFLTTPSSLYAGFLKMDATKGQDLFKYLKKNVAILGDDSMVFLPSVCKTLKPVIPPGLSINNTVLKGRVNLRSTASVKLEIEDSAVKISVPVTPAVDSYIKSINSLNVPNHNLQIISAVDSAVRVEVVGSSKLAFKYIGDD